MRYYIADCHFGDDKVRKLDGRPFADAEEMDACMIERWNQVVKKRKDEVVILGDLSSLKGERTNELLRQLNGKKYLITGNHDRYYLRDKQFDETLFEWVKPYAELHDNNRKVVLSHYPMICYHGQYAGKITYMLYGHVHNTMDSTNVERFVRETRETVYGEEKKPIACNLINCFTMFSDYTPWSLDQWIAWQAAKKDGLKKEGILSL